MSELKTKPVLTAANSVPHVSWVWAGVVLACVLKWWPATSMGEAWLLNNMLTAIQTWTIAFHEYCHAVGGWLTGASVVKIDTHASHGTTWTTGGWYPLISLAGYMGSAGFGAMLMRYAQSAWMRPVYHIIMASFIVGLLVKGDWNLALFLSLGISALTMACIQWDRTGLTLSFIATLFLFTGFDDMQMLLWYNTGNTDAGLLADYVGLHFLAWPFALVYCGICATLWWLALRRFLKK